MGLVDEDESFIFVNPAAERIFGVNKDTLLGRNLREFVDDAAWQLINLQSEVRKTGKSSSYETAITRPDGERRYLQVTASPDIANGGDFQGTFALIQDITERKRAEEELRRLNLELEERVAHRTVKLMQSQERYRGLVECCPDAVFIHSAERIVFANQAAANLLGADVPEELLSTSIWDYVHPESVELVKTRGHQLIRKAENLTIAEEKLVRPNGEIVIAEVSSILTTYEGHPAIQVIARDITKRKRAEDALRQSEERLNLALQGAADGVWDYDVQSGHIYRSPRMMTLLGYTSDEIEPTIEGLAQYIHPDDRQWVEYAFNAHLEGRTPYYQTEHRLRTKSGSWCWVLDTGRVVAWDAEDKPLRVAGTHKDIDERKRAEEALRHSEEKFRLLTEQALFGVIIVQENRIAFMNANVAKITGYDMDELSERTEQEILNLIHEDDRERVVEETYAVLGNETGQLTRLEYRLITKDSEIRWVDQLAKPIEYQGQKSTMVTLLDITERKQAEEALRQSELRFRSTFADAAIGMSQSSLDGRYLQVNDALCDILGYSREELLNMRFQDLTHPDDLQGDLKRTQRLLDGIEKSFKMEKRYLHKQGQVVWAILGLSIVRNAEKQPQYFIAQIQDITERKQAEQERDRLISELSEALMQVKALRGLLPICSVCKKIRDDQGYWQRLEAYITQHSDAEFTHSICPECAHKLYPELVADKDSK